MMYINGNIGVMEEILDVEHIAPLPTHELFLTDALYMEGIINPTRKDVVDMKNLVLEGMSYNQAARLVRSIKGVLVQCEALRIKSLIHA